MLKYRRIIQDSARRIATAANRAVAGYIADDLERETDLTAAMLARMKKAMDGYKTRNVQWTARTLAVKTQNGAEDAHTADFLGVVEFDLPECRVKKGFLALARHIERGQSILLQEWELLAEQCEKMLAITGESFVFIYARSGIVVIPALAILSATGPGNPHDAYSRSALRFYQDHFECFVGDLELGTADVAALERLRTRHALLLTASPISPPTLQMKLGEF